MDAIKQRIVEAVDSLRPVVQDIAAALYEKPELGLQELFAVQKLTWILKDAGFSIETGTGGLPTAFLARHGEGRPVIAFMGEYDALPEIGHGCGHNLMGATAVACGIAMSRVLPDKPWIVLGTPAEETIGGKVTMADAGVFDEIDAALIAHPGQRNSVGGGVYWASHPLEITFHGRSAHAGGNPQGGINALDACVAAYTAIRNLRHQLNDAVRIAGIISHGGGAQNVIPDFAQLKFTLRSTDWKYLENTIIPKVKRCAEGAAAMYGATVEFKHHEQLFRDTLDHPILQDLCRANFELIGEEVPPPIPGAGGGVTDVGNVTWVTPCIQIGYKMSDARGHSREMADATVTPAGIDAALKATKVLCLTAYDLVSKPELLREAREYLNKQKET